MTIHGLYYFNDKGEIGYFDTPDDPFYLGPQQSAIGNSLFNSNCGIGWYFFRGQDDRGQVRLSFEKRWRALYDAIRTCIIAIGRQTPSIVWPHNAVVFNEDGTLNHVIEFPAYVEHSFDGTTTGKFKPEVRRTAYVRCAR
jgi:hypothetical protein